MTQLPTRDQNNVKLAEWLRKCGVDLIGWPDFYHDEAANALLLENIPHPFAALFHDAHGWTMECKTELGEPIVAISPYRKTAICQAALQRIERGEK